jgi:NitT/TauT family transport system permease protein
VSPGLRKALRTYGLPLASFAILLGIWELMYRYELIPTFILPAPTGIAEETWEWRYRLVEHTWVTFYETMGGFALSIAVGIPLAVMLVYSPVLRDALYPLIVVAHSIPKVAIAPVLLLIFGYGEMSKVLVAFLVAFFPIIVSTATGLAGTPGELLDLSRSYRASQFKIFLKVRFPMALPHVFSGLKVAITLAVIGAVVAEFVGSDRGLGYIIVAATSFWNADLAFGAIIILSAMAVILFGAVTLAERILCPWYTPDDQL